MNRLSRNAIAAFLLSALSYSINSWAAPTCLDTQGGIGGTGSPVASGGIGGTGSPVASGGIGGTGIPVAEGGIGGTGIVGTITGFGSVCVNGLEVDYSNQTPVMINGRLAGVSDLAIGQVISMVADTAPDGLRARSIEILNMIEGPISQAPQGNELEVMGQRVLLSAAASSRINVATLQAGEKVRISGYRDDQQRIFATRIDLSPQLKEESVIGSIEKTATGDAYIQGVKVMDANSGVVMLSPKTELLVTGHWDGKVLQVSGKLPDPATHNFSESQHIVLEGLVQNTQAEHDQLKVNGIDIAIRSQTSIVGSDQLQNNQVVRISGQMDANRTLHAEHIVIEPARFERSDREIHPHKGSRDTHDSVHEKSSTKADRQDSHSSSGKSDAPHSIREKVERTEAVERPGSIERPEVVERPERPERPQPPERIERPD